MYKQEQHKKIASLSSIYAWTIRDSIPDRKKRFFPPRKPPIEWVPVALSPRVNPTTHLTVNVSVPLRSLYALVTWTLTIMPFIVDHTHFTFAGSQ